MKIQQATTIQKECADGKYNIPQLFRRSVLMKIQQATTIQKECADENTTGHNYSEGVC